MVEMGKNSVFMWYGYRKKDMWYDGQWYSHPKGVNHKLLQVALSSSIIDIYPHPKAICKSPKIKCDGIQMSQLSAK